MFLLHCIHHHHDFHTIFAKSRERGSLVLQLSWKLTNYCMTSPNAGLLMQKTFVGPSSFAMSGALVSIGHINRNKLPQSSVTVKLSTSWPHMKDVTATHPVLLLWRSWIQHIQAEIMQQPCFYSIPIFWKKLKILKQMPSNCPQSSGTISEKKPLKFDVPRSN